MLTAIKVCSVVVSPHEGRINFFEALGQAQRAEWPRLEQVVRVENVILISCRGEIE